MKKLQSKLNKIGIYEVCYFDDKRYILDGVINSLTNFHKDILKNKSIKFMLD